MQTIALYNGLLPDVGAYIRKSTIYAMLKGQEIGINDNTNFLLENTSTKYKLKIHNHLQVYLQVYPKS